MTDYTVDSDGNGGIVAAPIETPYDAKRDMAYPRLGEQLDMLWHEINNNGTITDSGEWFNSIKSVKEQFPKE